MIIDFQLEEVSQIDIDRSVLEFLETSKLQPSEGLKSWKKIGRFAHIFAGTLQIGILAFFIKIDFELRLLSFSEKMSVSTNEFFTPYLSVF